jgi:hypothetical protein
MQEYPLAIEPSSRGPVRERQTTSAAMAKGASAQLTVSKPNGRNHLPARHRNPGGIARNNGRHHLGMVGDIISECLGDIIGIRSLSARRRYHSRLLKTCTCADSRIGTDPR